MSERPTLKSLDAKIDGLAERVEQFKVPDRDAESSVIDKCVRAIDRLPTTRRNDSYNAREETDRDAVGRVLDYLRQRYGLRDPFIDGTALRQRLSEVEQERDLLAQRLSSVQNAANGGWSA